MNHKKIIWCAFILLVFLQLWVPAAVIFSKQETLAQGRAYKFRTAPVDPNDYLRGKYIFLQFTQNRVKLSGNIKWEAGQEIYVDLDVDEKGFARIHSIHDHITKHQEIDHIKTTIDYVSSTQPYEMVVKWPFERFYMEESKAPLAEEAYNKLRVDSSMVSYALVKVNNGDAVLENVFINDIPIDVFIKN